MQTRTHYIMDKQIVLELWIRYEAEMYDEEMRQAENHDLSLQWENQDE